MSYSNCPGKYNKRITIQSPTGTNNSFTDNESWAGFATVWAAIFPLQGKAYFEANRENTEVTARLDIRYLAGVVRNMRILYKEHIYEIIDAINVNEANREMQLMCREVL